MNRGINFKNYCSLLQNLSDGKTEGITRSEYKKAIIKLLADDLEKNYTDIQINKDNIEYSHQNYTCLGYFKIGYYARFNNNVEYLYITFYHDMVVFNGLRISYL